MNAIEQVERHAATEQVLRRCPFSASWPSLRSDAVVSDVAGRSGRYGSPDYNDWVIRQRGA
jgi:hypothetical protein